MIDPMQSGPGMWDVGLQGICFRRPFLMAVKDLGANLSRWPPGPRHLSPNTGWSSSSYRKRYP
jgi:hypothetical protein